MWPVQVSMGNKRRARHPLSEGRFGHPIGGCARPGRLSQNKEPDAGAGGAGSAAEAVFPAAGGIGAGAPAMRSAG